MRVARTVLATLVLVSGTLGCGDFATAPPDPTAAALKVSAAPPTQEVSIEVIVNGVPTGVTLSALYHLSKNNVWVNFGARQDGGVVSGPGRLQFAAGRTRAEGVLTIPVQEGTLTIDLAQFDGLAQPPFVNIGPGGGCIVGVTGILIAQNVPQPVQVLLEWGTPQAP